MRYSNFDRVTGRLKSSSMMPDDYTIPVEDDIIVMGIFDPNRHYLNVYTVVVEDAGDAPSAFHYLAGMDGWVLDRNAAESATRALRDRLLAESDWIEFPSARNRLSTEEGEKWWDYRQALRDVPSQSGFPLEVRWPKKPNNKETSHG